MSRGVPVVYGGEDVKTAQTLSTIIGNILNPLKGKIPNRDFKYLETRMIEIGSAKISK